MITKAGIYAHWKPVGRVSGSATAGRVWVESMNSKIGTAIVRYDAGEGVRSLALCARLTDLTETGSNGWRDLA